MTDMSNSPMTQENPIDVQDSGNALLLLTSFGKKLGISHDAFKPEYLDTNSLIKKTLVGRGKVYFFNWSKHLLALRNYYRGGLVAKLSRDSFIYTGVENTRCYQELALLEFLNRHK
jgi:3-deoxy-D-manno-octulosonic acid kinase